MKTGTRLRLVLGAGVAAPLLAASPAQANGIPLVTGQLAGAIEMLLASQNLCVTFTYDANGNRVTQVNNGISPTAPTWGSRTYPCFTWGT